jgi:protein phosphatase
VQPESPARAQSHGWLFVTADGVGGSELGEVASRLAVESMLANFRNSAGGESHTPLLRRIIQGANQAVYEAGRSAGPGGVSMSTTTVACAFRYDRVVVAHVGDSRCYLLRHGKAAVLTRDHTVAADQQRLGLITAKEAAESSKRHVLSRSLGSDLFVSADISEHQVMPGDVLVLCSDGLHNSVGEDDLPRLLTGQSPVEASAECLVNLANQRDGGDNISVQVVRIKNVERVGMYRGRLYRLR